MTGGSRSAAQQVIEDCCRIARCSEDPGRITRTFLSSPMVEVHRILRASMEQAGMTVRVDAIGNLRGLYRCQAGGPRTAAPGRLLMGSHIDTVPHAGAFDGVLGVALAIALVRELGGRCLDFDIEVIAFSEEEGVRFGVPFLGSRALIGEVDDELLQRRDKAGVSMEQAIRGFGLEPSEMSDAAVSPYAFAYVELHIEQGPVLDSLIGNPGESALGIVEAIVGQTRAELSFVGKANHAGTTPMKTRRDALAGAAEWILAVEAQALSVEGMVATIGKIDASPGTANVVPGEVKVSLDLRHADDAVREAAVTRALSAAEEIAERRGLRAESCSRINQLAVKMNAALADKLEAAVIATGSSAHRILSGAGHDAMVIARKIPSAMLFLRSPDGVSHHPDEAVHVEDVQAALDAGLYFLDHL